MSIGEAEARAEGRREAAPAALLALLVFVALALVSWARDGNFLASPGGRRLLGVPAFLLTIDLSLTSAVRASFDRGEGRF